jgi:hypothetical protein
MKWSVLERIRENVENILIMSPFYGFFCRIGPAIGNEHAGCESFHATG